MAVREALHGRICVEIFAVDGTNPRDVSMTVSW